MPDRRDENEIVTPRLKLRPLTLADGPEIVAGVGDFAVSKWLTSVPHPYGPEDARWFIEHVRGKRHHWAITRRDRLLGVISVDEELGYWLAPDAWGRGIATEAAFSVVDRWFAASASPDMVAGHFAGNDASAEVLRKLGFKYSGARVQHCRARGEDVPGRTLRLTRARWQEQRTLPNLHTPRLYTRPLTVGDAARLVDIAGNPEVARNTGSIPAPWAVVEARTWIDAGRWQARPGFRLAVCDRSGRIVGMAGLSKMDEDGASSVAYLLEKSLWNRGLVTEVMTALIAAAFRAFPLRALVADHYTDNPASGAVLCKLGFRPVGSAMAKSLARLEPAPVSLYRLERSSFEAVA